MINLRSMYFPQGGSTFFKGQTLSSSCFFWPLSITFKTILRSYPEVIIVNYRGLVLYNLPELKLQRNILFVSLVYPWKLKNSIYLYLSI